MTVINNSLNSSITGLYHRSLRAVGKYILPPSCLACENQLSDEGFVCGTCWASIRHIDHPMCAVLGVPFSHDLGSGAQSAQAIANPPTYYRARSTVMYDQTPRRLIQGFKFSDRTDLGPWLARWMVNWAKRTEPSLLTNDTLIIPVPLHTKRLLSRRFNQAAELARYIAKEENLRHRPDLLHRVKATRQQVGLGFRERAKNVKGAFRVPTEAKPTIKGAHILLIDDVYTTGATLEACARALKRAGARQIDCLTFARVATDDV